MCGIINSLVVLLKQKKIYIKCQDAYLFLSIKCTCTYISMNFLHKFRNVRRSEGEALAPTVADAARFRLFTRQSSFGVCAVSIYMLLSR